MNNYCFDTLRRLLPKAIKANRNKERLAGDGTETLAHAGSLGFDVQKSSVS